MKTDVSTLIAALTTERDALDRAITALSAISSHQNNGSNGVSPAKIERRKWSLSSRRKASEAAKLRWARRRETNPSEEIRQDESGQS